MSQVKLLIELSQEKQIEIEEMCHREGLTFSKYFLDLHENEQKRKFSDALIEEYKRKVAAGEVFVGQPQSIEEESLPTSRPLKEKKRKNEKEA